MEKKVTLTPAQMEALTPYEKNMLCAVKSDYTRGLGKTGLTACAEVYKTVTGREYFLNLSCNFWCTDLVRRVGRWYFATKEAGNSASPVEAGKSPVTQRKPRKTKSKAQ